MRSRLDYDEASRVRGCRGTHSQNVRYAYDAKDNLKTITDSLNRITKFDYDALNRLIKTTDTKNGLTQYSNGVESSTPTRPITRCSATTRAAARDGTVIIPVKRTFQK